MYEFCLYRIKVFPKASGQLSLFGNRSRPEILEEIVRSLPSSEMRRGGVWHIGNVEEIDEKSLYLRIGRTKRTVKEAYTDGAFTDVDDVNSPYTHLIVDFPLEVCAIAKKSKLASNTLTVARQFIRLLSESDKTNELGADLQIDEIRDPSDFIRYIEEAVSISRFWFSFFRHNPLDVNKQLVFPLQQALEEISGKDGKLEFSGSDLDIARLEDITRYVAATGADAGATLVLADASKAVKKSLKGSTAIITTETVDNDEDKRILVQNMRAVYRMIRGTD